MLLPGFICTGKISGFDWYLKVGRQDWEDYRNLAPDRPVIHWPETRTGVLITKASVTLSGGPDDVWIFQIAGNLTVNNSATVTLSGGAQAKNVFWQVSGQATLGTAADFKGVILSQTLISLNTGTRMTGRALAQTAVTLNATAITAP